MNYEASSSKSEVHEMEDLELTEKAKLWVVTSIALNNVFIPGLNRDYVVPEMKNHYHNLVEQYHIDDIQEFQFPPELWKYKSDPPLNDDTYTVSNYDQLSQLYIAPYMRKHDKLINFDAYGVLTVLSNASCFVQNVKKEAEKVRKYVRNDVAHCSEIMWNEKSFNNYFSSMIQLLENLPKN